MKPLYAHFNFYTNAVQDAYGTNCTDTRCFGCLESFNDVFKQPVEPKGIQLDAQTL